MDVNTSIGAFSETTFIKRCNEKSFPEGLLVYGALFLSECTTLKSLPDGLHVCGGIDLRGCTSLTALPEGLQVGKGLYLRGCTSLTALPDGLKVGGKIFVDHVSIERYPFRSIPKILHLPFLEDIKQILIERLKNGY
jgi:hypothetical protein